MPKPETIPTPPTSHLIKLPPTWQEELAKLFKALTEFVQTCTEKVRKEVDA